MEVVKQGSSNDSAPVSENSTEENASGADDLPTTSTKMRGKWSGPKQVSYLYFERLYQRDHFY